ncbi:MarR family winged helix-turn-helix transcriptional regulator [Chitinophaga silvatica]|nr:MarR family transcriptional regulator [Chitinophaga silvatica]
MISKEDQEIAQALRHLITLLGRRLRKQANIPDALSIAEGNVLSMLMTHETLYPSEIGAQLNLSSQFLSQILKRLEGLGYITRNSASEDKRKTIVSLTAKGKRIVLESREAREAWLAETISERFTPAQKKVMKEALTYLTTLTDL